MGICYNDIIDCGDYMDKIRYYNSEKDDFVILKHQDYVLKDNYKWVHTNIFYKFFSYILYYIVLIFSFFFTKLVLHVSIKNKKCLKNEKSYFIYGNHTHPLGDVLNPLLVNFPKRPFYIANASNLGLPIIGKLLPMLGAIPIPNQIHKMKLFLNSINYYIDNNKVIAIYPEAHVWPYNTFIREFPSTSFRFPVEQNVASFSMTTTYQKRKYFKKPKITIFIDGPFYPNKNLSKKEQIKDLRNSIFKSMVLNSNHSNYDYIKYIKKD